VHKGRGWTKRSETKNAVLSTGRIRKYEWIRAESKKLEPNWLNPIVIRHILIRLYRFSRDTLPLSYRYARDKGKVSQMKRLFHTKTLNDDIVLKEESKLTKFSFFSVEDFTRCIFKFICIWIFLNNCATDGKSKRMYTFI
jgi:hypothetical protein